MIRESFFVFLFGNDEWVIVAPESLVVFTRGVVQSKMTDVSDVGKAVFL